MGNDRRSFKQIVTDSIGFVSSLLLSVASLFASVEKAGGIRIAALIFAVLGLSWFGFLLVRYIKRRKDDSHKLYPDKAPGDTGFNEALSYTVDDAHRFYGRQTDTSHLLHQILRDEYRLGVLHGESGVGKTSIIQAGLIPELKKKNIPWSYISFNSLHREIRTTGELTGFLIRHASRAFGLPPCWDYQELSEKLAEKQTGAGVVFLDQFEQLFDRTSEEVRMEFAHGLEQAGLPGQGLKFVVIVREDYFGRVDDMFQRLEQNAKTYIKKFNPAQARDVIRKSAGYDEALSDTTPDDPLLAFEDAILDDLKDKDQKVHPVELSLICSTMMKVNGKLDRRGYVDGGKKQGWLNRYLDDVLKGQPRRESLQLLSGLIYKDKAATLTDLEISQRSGLGLPETRRLLRDFQQSRLVVTNVTEGENEEKRYRLAHEYLIAPIRLHVGDVETPVEKYGRLLDARVEAWERENRNPHHLLRGKNLLTIRFGLRKHLCWDLDPLKKTFVRKSFSRYLVVMLSSFVLVLAVLTGVYFTVHSLIEEKRFTEYLSELRYTGPDYLGNVEKHLLRLSKESIGFKIKVLEKILSADNRMSYRDEIMPVLYHTLIGLSEDNGKKVVDCALNKISPENADKLKWLITMENRDLIDRNRCQKKLLDTLEKTSNAAAQILIIFMLADIGDEKAVERLNKLLERSSDVSIISRAAEALGKIGSNADIAIDKLIELLDDPDDYVKSRAAVALGKIGSNAERAVDKLIELIDRTEGLVMSSAVEALGKTGGNSERAVDKLIELLNRPFDFISNSTVDAVNALVNIGSNAERAVDKLIELLDDPDDYVKSRAAVALGKIGSNAERAVDKLIELLNNPDDSVKICAAVALVKIGSNAEIAVNKLIELLDRTKDSVRNSAAVALGEIGIPAKDALPRINQLYEKEKDLRRKFFFLQAMLRVEPSNRRHLTKMIDELLAHPFAVLKKEWSIDDETIKPSILRAVGEVASTDEEGKKMVGKNLDFDGNMWTMLKWWKTYKGPQNTQKTRKKM